MLGSRTSLIMTMHTGSLWSNGFHAVADLYNAALSVLGQDEAAKIVLVIKAPVQCSGAFYQKLSGCILIVFGRKLLSIARSQR